MYSTIFCVSCKKAKPKWHVLMTGLFPPPSPCAGQSTLTTRSIDNGILSIRPPPFFFPFRTM